MARPSESIPMPSNTPKQIPVSDLVALAAPDLTMRLRAIQDSAIGQKLDKLPALQLLCTNLKNPDANRALNESIPIIIVTWLDLNKTSLGLLIRAVMQNRNMAACMGVRTERVNTMTFAFGCGLAGLAGAFLSQIGNVGPSMGQLYIVDSFMTVVVGGVGNILGTVISALGIGMADQTLQQYLGNPVIGKILVLGAIILFLQWRPAGLFVTRSRSLD